MRSTSDWFVYAIANVMYIFTIYKCMYIIFKRTRVAGRLVFAAYTAAYVLSACVYMLDGRPAANVAVNIIMLSLLTLLYESSFVKRCIAAAAACFFLAAADGAAGLLLHAMDPLLLSAGKLRLMTERMTGYVLVILLQNIQSAKNNINAPRKNLVLITLVPLLSIYALLQIGGSDGFAPDDFNRISIAFLVINLAAFYLLDALNMSFNQELMNEMDLQQVKAAASQLEIMKHTQTQIREIKHDLLNHMNTMRELLKNGEAKKTMLYLENTFHILQQPPNHIQTGNIAIDSILNYKMNKAQELGIHLQTNIVISSRLRISDFDLITILGNLLDNAIEAVSQIEKKTSRYIKLNIFFEKNMLRITCENQCIPSQIDVKNLRTTKSDKENHGIGLNNIKRTVKKYKGDIHIMFIEDRFIADLIMLNP